MKNVKKNIMVFGAVVVAIIMVSTVTAVGQVQSQVMDKIEQSDSLLTQFNELANSVGLNTQNLNVNDQQQIEQLLQNIDLNQLGYNLKNFDINGLITSDKFINFMNSPQIYNVVTSNEFLALYNTNAVQNFINSQMFTDFSNSADCQYFLSHLNIGSFGTQLNSQNSNTVLLQSQLKTMTINTQQVSQTLQTTTIGNSPKSTSPQSTLTSSKQVAAAQTQGQINTIAVAGGSILGALAGLILGFIFGIYTWILGAIAILIGTPFLAIWLGAIVSLILFGIFPGLLSFQLITACVGFTLGALLGVLVGIGAAILYPVICAIVGATFGAGPYL